MTNLELLQVYQEAINKIEDYFEYRNESDKDRVYVHKVLVQLSEDIKLGATEDDLENNTRVE